VARNWSTPRSIFRSPRLPTSPKRAKPTRCLPSSTRSSRPTTASGAPKRRSICLGWCRNKNKTQGWPLCHPCCLDGVHSLFWADATVRNDNAQNPYRISLL